MNIITGLSSGINNIVVPFGGTISGLTIFIENTIQNKIDDNYYICSVSDITPTGYTVSFSDNLASTGYSLISQINI